MTLLGIVTYIYIVTYMRVTFVRLPAGLFTSLCSMTGSRVSLVALGHRCFIGNNLLTLWPYPLFGQLDENI